jgi:hypothetical protein
MVDEQGNPIGYAFDIESDNLYLKGTLIWYIKFKSLCGTRTLQVWPFREEPQVVYDKVTQWIDSFPDGALVVGHNHLGYDLWTLWRHLKVTPRVGKQGKDWLEGKHVQYVDTFVLSMYLHPNSPKHSLAFLTGEDTKVNPYLDSDDSDEEQEDTTKIDYRKSLIVCGAMTGSEPKGFEFSFYHDLLIPYCDRDVDGTIMVFFRLWKQAQEMYGKDNWIHPSFRQMQKDYWLYSAQAYTGVKFNKEKAQALITHVETEMLRIKNEVDPLLPPRPLKNAEKALYKMPAKPYSKTGEPSASLTKWLEKHNAVLKDGMVSAYGLCVPLVANEILPVEMPMEISDNTEIKQYFLDNGWVPHEDFYNFKRGPDGKPMKDEKNKYIRTTPKINSQGKLCPNLQKLDGEIPAKIVKFLSYRNRLGVVKGWMNNWRIEFDGRLSAEISGYAPTSRVKHKVVVNCPKAAPDILLGNEMRDLFCVDEGNWYIGTDAAALEARTLSHHTFKYDNGKFARMQTEGDPHSFNAFAFFPHLHKEFDINDQENKENPKFKPWRNKAKTGAYLLAFGGGAPKLATSLGLSPAAGKAAYDNYWEMNEGLGLLKKAVEGYFDSKGKKKHVPAVDGRLVSVRGKNVLLSCLGQGTGAIAMSYAGCLMDTWLGEMYLDGLGRPYYLYNGKVVKRISMVH